MNYTFKNKNYALPEDMKQKIVQKLNRLSKMLPENTDVTVHLSAVKQENKVEVTIPVSKRILRAEVKGQDMLNAVDEVVDVLDKQMVRYKTRLRERSRRDTRYTDEYDTIFKDNTTNDTPIIKIEKTKRFAVKPMDAEEAVMEMELLGHGFYVFHNSETDEMNVVYKRNDGSYGLIEPEY